jgi:hypothetical protein
LLKQQLLVRGWTILNDSPVAVLCIQPPPRFGDARSIVEKILSAGRVWVAAATFEGREIIRACVTHGETTPDDITELVNSLHAAG